MGIRFACHVCDQPLNIKRELAGRVGICPKCDGRFRIPHQDAPHSLPLEAAASDAQPWIADQPMVNQPNSDSGSVAQQSAAQQAAAGDAQPPPSPLDDPDAQWYVRPPAGGQYGPASGEVIRSWIGEHRITPSTLIWRQGWGQWRSGRDALPELAGAGPGDGGEVGSAADDSETIASLDTPPSQDAAEPVILFGQPAIGNARSSRNQRRRMMVILLVLLSICLLGLLILLALR